MTTSVQVSKASSTKIITGGTAQVVFPANSGGLIVNPEQYTDQGLPSAETLYVDPTGPAKLMQTSTTTALGPGQSIQFALSSNPVWVNAVHTGHEFTALLLTSGSTYPPTPIVGPFPPPGPTTMTSVIPSYLYAEYTDDDTLPAFIEAYNTIAQDYIDTLNDLNLPIYTNANISGGLLDWVGAGLYGLPRPTISSFRTVYVGDLNTYEFNSLMLNELEILYPGNIIVTTDDIYKRILTWHFYKGDGKYFTIDWLKRRVMRFLIGENGTAPNIDQTYQISVTFGSGMVVTIRFIDYITTVTASAEFNTDEFNTAQFNELSFYNTPLNPLPNRQIFQEAVNSGALELPFQYTWNVQI